MSHLNYEFFDEFKALDNLCRDIYGESADKKLGVTLYLEHMEQLAYRGALKVPSWTSDYNHLKSARNMRNELAHSRTPMTVNICSQEDIDFVRSLRERILNQTDPIALLRQKSMQPRPSSASQTNRRPQPSSASTTRGATSLGCLGMVAAFSVALACITAFLL